MCGKSSSGVSEQLVEEIGTIEAQEIFVACGPSRRPLPPRAADPCSRLLNLFQGESLGACELALALEGRTISRTAWLPCGAAAAFRQVCLRETARNRARPQYFRSDGDGARRGAVFVAEAIEHQAAGDGERPGARALDVDTAPPVPDAAQKRFLGDFLGILVASGRAGEIAVDGAGVFAEVDAGLFVRRPDVPPRPP